MDKLTECTKMHTRSLKWLSQHIIQGRRLHIPWTWYHLEWCILPHFQRLLACECELVKPSIVIIWYCLA